MKYKTKKGLQSLLLIIVVGLMIYDMDYDKITFLGIFIDIFEIVVVLSFAIYNYFWRNKEKNME